MKNMPDSRAKIKPAQSPLDIRIGGPEGEHILIKQKRVQWALRELVEAGPRGCTPFDNPAPRWSAYVFNLRELGLDIETVHEGHGGDFPDSHGRYVMRSKVEIEPDFIGAFRVPTHVTAFDESLGARSVGYRREDLDDWLLACRRKGTSDTRSVV